ncbi:MAG: CerR family C-terminal domain-containing protein [Phycisphaerae bacterium]|nr:CerR family C-terminal domain-containing protein [Phycisphaerae bacterium]
MSTTSHARGDTRQRLLEAAGEVFAERGFRSATVREICQKSKSNVAAVNYHFGDKRRLYEAVLQHAHAWATQGSAVFEESQDAAPERRLRDFIRSMLLKPFDQGRPSWQSKLMIREMIEPTRALDALIEQYFRPRFERLTAIVLELLERKVSTLDVRLCASSVVGQCIHFHRARAVIARLNPEITYTPEDIEMLADHIARFSLAAIENLPSDEE